MSSAALDSPLVFCSEAAAKRIGELMVEEGNYNLKLRIYITGGGCSGFQYGFAFDENVREDDEIVEKEVTLNDAEVIKVNLLVDSLSLMYLTGAQVDYIENLQGAHFTVKNPNAETTCSCGASFSLDVKETD